MAVEVRRSPGCLRGLQYDFILDPPLGPDVIVAAIEAAHPGRLVRGHEEWPTGTVTRLVLQFRAEFRIGERPGQVSLVHRLSAPMAMRAADRESLRVLLAELKEA